MTDGILSILRIINGLLPLIFAGMVVILTYIWWSINWIRLSSLPERWKLLLTHVISGASLAAIALGSVWSPTPWEFVVLGAAAFIISLVAKVTQVKKLPLGLWHFTRRNRDLVKGDRISLFHLENDLAAMATLVILMV